MRFCLIALALVSLARAHPVRDRIDVFYYLVKYGYMRADASKAQLLTEESLQEGIKQFQVRQLKIKDQPKKKFKMAAYLFFFQNRNLLA